MADISVIIPSYNQALYIADAIHSVYNQTFTNWELIVVDDGSTDNTSEVLETLKDPRMRILRQTNKGVSSARNAGIGLSSAPMVAFLDADDLFIPDALGVLSACLRANSELGMAVGSGQRADSSGRIYENQIIKPTHLGFPDLLFENNILTGSLMVRRKWLDLVGGFDESLHTNEDWDLWLRLVLAGCQLSQVEKVVMKYRTHANQVTRDVNRMRKDTLGLWEKFFNLSNLPSDLLAYRNSVVASALIRTSARAFRMGEFDVGNQDLLEAMRLNPNLRLVGYKQLVDLLRGWASDPKTQDPEAYLLAISRNLTPLLPGLGDQLRKALAAMILEPLFGASPAAWRTHRQALVKAVFYDPSWLLNRGVLRMLVEAWFPVHPRKVA